MQVTFRHTMATDDTRSKTSKTYAEREKPGVFWGVGLEFPRLLNRFSSLRGRSGHTACK